MAKYLVTAQHSTREDMCLRDFPYFDDMELSHSWGSVLPYEDSGKYFAAHPGVGQGTLAISPEQAIRAVLESAECTEIEIIPGIG